MKAFKRVRVYLKKNEPGLYFVKEKTGVYIIFENRKRVYVGHSTYDLYKTITRHFQKWNDKGNPDRISYNGKLQRNQYSVLVIFTTSKQAESLERLLITKHHPRDNHQKYEQFQQDQYDKQTEKVYVNTIADLEDPPF